MRKAVPHTGRPCSICTHEHLEAIDRELLEPGVVIAKVARRYAVRNDSLARHRKNHLSITLRREAEAAFEVGEVARSASLNDRVDSLYDRAGQLLRAMEKEKDFRGATTAIKEMRGCLELLGKLAGQIDPGTTINVFNAPAWVTVQTNVLAALTPFPEARAAVTLALEASSADGA